MPLGGRARRQERREDRQEARQERRGDGEDEEFDDSGPASYVMREKLLAFGNDFEIKKASRRQGGRIGPTAFYVDNKVVRIRETFNLRKSRGGDTLYQIQERKARIRDAMAIEDSNGDKVAELKKRVIGVVRDNFVVKIRGDRDWQVHGSILEHDFKIKEGGRSIVTVHKNWIAPIKDAYFIDIDEDCDDEGLAVMVVIGLESLTEE
eukprot:scaffold14511_cov55-Cyclotella_meneghiniana.AAC.7